MAAQLHWSQHWVGLLCLVAATPFSPVPAQTVAPAARHAHGDAAQDEAKEDAPPGQIKPASGTKVYFIDVKDGQHLTGKTTITSA